MDYFQRQRVVMKGGGNYSITSSEDIYVHEEDENESDRNTQTKVERTPKPRDC